MEAAACAKPATEYTYARLGCGVLARGLAQLFCPTCHERYVVGWSCKGRGFCPSCGGRRMNAGALTLVDHVLPDVPLRQFVITLPFPLRFPLAFDGKLLGQVLRIFIDTVASNYRKRLADRGIAGGQYGAVTVIQRANSDLRCNPHVHAIFLDGLYAPDRDGKGFMFHLAPAPTQEDVEAIVERASKRILRFLQRRGVITLVTAPDDGEVTVVTDENIGDKDPLLARLLAAATAGAPPAGPANKRKPIRIVLDPDAHPVAKGNLCGQHAGFNLHAATKVAANDKQGRLALCKYTLRPPLANDRLKILDDNVVRLDGHCDGNPGRVTKPSRDGARRAKLAGSPRAAVVRWHLVGGTGSTGHHCATRCLGATSPAASHGLFWPTLVAQQLPPPVRTCPRARVDAPARRQVPADPAALTLYFMEPAAPKNVLDRHHVSSLPEPAAPHRPDQEWGHHQKDLVCHGPADRGTQTLSGKTSSV